MRTVLGHGLSELDLRLGRIPLSLDSPGFFGFFSWRTCACICAAALAFLFLLASLPAAYCYHSARQTRMRNHEFTRLRREFSFSDRCPEAKRFLGSVEVDGQMYRCPSNPAI